MPQWHAHVMQYKQLKQAIKSMRQQARIGDHMPQQLHTACLGEDDRTWCASGLRVEEASSSFVSMLDVEVDRVNEFYSDRIEEAVIILHSLQQQVQQLVSQHAALDQRSFTQRSLVSFHFNLLMLQNYVALNFTGLVKILKKFDKHMGSSLRAEYISTIVELPFYRCDVLGSLVEETEKQFQLLESERAAAPAAKVCGEPLGLSGLQQAPVCGEPIGLSGLQQTSQSHHPRRVEAV